MRSNLQKDKLNPYSKYWLNKASKAWGEFIHLDGECLVCGKTDGKLDAHHFLTKGGNHLLRCNPNNGGLLCFQHHKYNKEISAHGTPDKFNKWLQEKHPEKWAWMEANKFKTGKANWKENYELLCVLIDQKKAGLELEF